MNHSVYWAFKILALQPNTQHPHHFLLQLHATHYSKTGTVTKKDVNCSRVCTAAVETNIVNVRETN